MKTRMSAQRYLRLRTGIVVTAAENKVHDKTTCEVLDSDGIVHRYQDDPFCTMTTHIFTLVYGKASTVLNAQHQFQRYFANSSQVYSNHFDYEHSLESFDRPFFEEQVLPVIEKFDDPKTRGFVAWYGEVKDGNDKETICDRSEVLFRLFTYLRQYGSNLPWNVSADVADAKIFEEAIQDPDCTTVLLDSQDDYLVRALQRIHKQGKVIEVDGRHFFKTKAIDPFKAIGGFQYEPDLSPLAIHRVARVADALAPVVEKSNPVPAGNELGVAMGNIVRLKGKPLQKLSVDDQIYVNTGGFAEFTEENLGKSALRGLGKLVGVGELEECLLRLAKHFNAKSGQPIEHCYHFAAGRIIKMNEKIVKGDGNGSYKVMNK